MVGAGANRETRSSQLTGAQTSFHSGPSRRRRASPWCGSSRVSGHAQHVWTGRVRGEAAGDKGRGTDLKRLLQYLHGSTLGFWSRLWPGSALIRAALGGREDEPSWALLAGSMMAGAPDDRPGRWLHPPLGAQRDGVGVPRNVPEDVGVVGGKEERVAGNVDATTRAG